MKSNELFEQIHAGIIKDNSTIKVMTEEGQVITKIKYENKGLKWEQGKFDTKYLCDIDIEFEVEEPYIDIQGIEEFSSEYTMNNVEFQFQDKINQILLAVKQLNKEIKELKSLDIEISEKDINEALKKAREQLKK